MTLNDIIGDVARRLYWDDGSGEIPPETTNEIVRGISRLFDRFSIDGRKLPTICELEHQIKTHDTNLSVGRGKDFDIWGLPQAIYYAAWRHTECSEHTVSRGIFNPLCDEYITVRYNDGDFHHNFQCKDEFYGRPSELYYQRGEIIFSSQPCIGDKLIIRAKMPFDVQLGNCMPRPVEKKPEFHICPSHIFSNEVRQQILEEARDKYVEDKDWCMTTWALPCDNACAEPVKVTVTAKLPKEHDKVTFDGELPDGYAATIYDILVYDLAPVAGVDITPDIKLNRDAAVKLLHRSNDDPNPIDRDYTTTWAMRGRYYEDYYDESGAAHSGRGG